MFGQNILLKDVIFEYLKGRQESISGIHKKLEEDGYKFHRLMVTGYLKAMSDLGQLKETDIPPAKVYSVQAAHRNESIYEALGGLVKRYGLPQKEEAGLAVHCMHRLFQRPVFREELQRCGLDAATVDASESSAEERATARRIFTKTAIKIPFNDAAYVPRDAEKYERFCFEVVFELVRQAFNAGSLSIKGKQTKLEGLQ
ncbi:MAG: hypothetical protein CVT48_02530 [Thermoplasmata archaeon HGW-Thermoplasmata-1]|nr:MAG: hypothetical protein CVT48_02530 [Thermoplasmata archaeon HGW-Thermoplasmata-1]